jgi:hypothetical protein
MVSRLPKSNGRGTEALAMRVVLKKVGSWGMVSGLSDLWRCECGSPMLNFLLSLCSPLLQHPSYQPQLLATLVVATWNNSGPHTVHTLGNYYIELHSMFPSAGSLISDDAPFDIQQGH